MFNLQETLDGLRRIRRRIPECERLDSLIGCAYSLNQCMSSWTRELCKVECFETFRETEFVIEVLDAALNSIDERIHERFKDELTPPTSSREPVGGDQISETSDGQYQYIGAIDDVGADVNDRDAFVEAAKDHAANAILRAIAESLQPTQIAVDVEQGTYTILFQIGET